MPSFARENPHDRAESNDRSGGKRWGEKGSKKSEVGILASYFRFNGGPEGSALRLQRRTWRSALRLQRDL